MPGPATIRVHVPPPLRPYVEGARELQVPAAASVRDVLAGLEKSHPSLYGSVCDETGAVRRHVGLFVNNAHMRDRNGLDTPLNAGDIVLFLPAVSGG
jgi:molybdopterin synthase sulfur carrier subunit